LDVEANVEVMLELEELVGTETEEFVESTVELEEIAVVEP